MMHGLTARVKYVRILFKFINGKRRWFAQLINEGIPFQKPANSTQGGIVGLDLNVSNIAYVANDEAGLLPFAEGVPTFQKTRLTNFLQKQLTGRAWVTIENHDSIGDYFPAAS